MTQSQILLFLCIQCLCALSSSPSLDRTQDMAIIDNCNKTQTLENGPNLFVCWDRLTCGLCALPLNFPQYLFSLGAFKTKERLKSYTPDPWWWISAPIPHTHTHFSLGFGFYHYLSPCHGQPEKLSLSLSFSLPMTLSLSLRSSVLAISVPMPFHFFLNCSFITCFELTLTKTREQRSTEITSLSLLTN